MFEKSLRVLCFGIRIIMVMAWLVDV